MAGTLRRPRRLVHHASHLRVGTPGRVERCAKSADQRLRDRCRLLISTIGPTGEASATRSMCGPGDDVRRRVRPPPVEQSRRAPRTARSIRQRVVAIAVDHPATDHHPRPVVGRRRGSGRASSRRSAGARATWRRAARSRARVVPIRRAVPVDGRHQGRRRSARPCTSGNPSGRVVPPHRRSSRHSFTSMMVSEDRGCIACDTRERSMAAHEVVNQVQLRPVQCNEHLSTTAASPASGSDGSCRCARHQILVLRDALPEPVPRRSTRRATYSRAQPLVLRGSPAVSSFLAVGERLQDGGPRPRRRRGRRRGRRPGADAVARPHQGWSAMLFFVGM